MPRGGPSPDVVLGGTITPAEGLPRHLSWSSLAEEEWAIQVEAERILRWCRDIKPALNDCEPDSVSVGYRPVKKSLESDQQLPVRVEPEFTGSLAGRLIHNYGHAGGGVTLSWGCAREVSKWIQWLCNS